MEKQQLKSLLEINASIASISDKKDLYKIAMNELQRLVGFDDAAVIVLYESGPGLYALSEQRFNGKFFESIVGKNFG